jgi:hypothetical protein
LILLLDIRNLIAFDSLRASALESSVPKVARGRLSKLEIEHHTRALSAGVKVLDAQSIAASSHVAPCGTVRGCREEGEASTAKLEH